MASGATEAMYYKHAAQVCKKRTFNMRLAKLMQSYGFDPVEYLYEQKTMRQYQLPLSEQDYLIWLYQDCECPITIAVEWIDALEKSEVIVKDDFILRYSTFTTLESFCRWGDRESLTSQILAHWIHPNGEPLDQQAMEAAEDSGMSITPEDYIDFILRYPDRKYSKTTYADRLRMRYKELTGIPLVLDFALWLKAHI